MLRARAASYARSRGYGGEQRGIQSIGADSSAALAGDEPEELEVVPWKLDDIDQLILREDFSEGRSIAALFIAREWLRQQR